MVGRVEGWQNGSTCYIRLAFGITYERDLLSEENCGREVVSKSDCFRYDIVPVQILGIDTEKSLAGQFGARGIKYIQGSVDYL